MTTKEPASDSEVEKININNSNSLGSSGMRSTNNWFRSIPRRIRKFISKQNRPSNQRNSHSLNNSNLNGNSNTTERDASCTNQIIIGVDADDTDESNLYSSVDYLGNDEEVAMIRACSQMAR